MQKTVTTKGVTAERLYSLKLHHALFFEHTAMIIRVPGGWIYSSVAGKEVFVPFNDEFKPRKKK